MAICGECLRFADAMEVYTAMSTWKCATTIGSNDTLVVAIDVFDETWPNFLFTAEIPFDFAGNVASASWPLFA